MAGEYDAIKTAKDLIVWVRAHGLSLDQDDLNRAADIFGHTPIEELAFLANDIGRDDENGNPDPKGTYSSGRVGTRSTFYQILFHIWNWEDATRFYNEHTMEYPRQITDLKCQIKMRDDKIEEAERKAAEMEQKAAASYKGFREAEEAVAKIGIRVRNRDRQIVELKAKLYDMGERIRELEQKSDETGEEE